MNREKHLMDTFPDKEGRTYIESMDKSLMCEYSHLPSIQSYIDTICSKCNSLLDKDGICWRCLTEMDK